ncbi:MAG: Crp/Fnr family transcriptional regulator [Clostridia bacterium]|nr:Crp/Fnr family transcriptional regulator [Clostridia bacterium]
MDEIITQEMKERFRACFLFNGIPSFSKETEKELMRDTVFFRRGECVYESDKFKNALGVIILGQVRVTSADEKSRVILRDMSAGETFGAAALFGAGELYVSKICAKSACAVTFISEDTLRALFSAYPEISVNYICFISSKIRYLNSKIAELSLPSAQARVLEHMRKHAGKDGKLRSGSMSAIAKTLNIGRSSLYRALSSLLEDGYILKNGDEWEIKKENHYES